MKKKIISFAAAIVLSLTALHAYADETDKSNSIDIFENFDSASPTGEEVYTGSSKDYTWNILATKDFGYASSNTYVAIPNENKIAVSLTKNNANNGTKNTILTIPNGVGGEDKDVDITLDAGVCTSFTQAVKVWELVFSSSDGTELFSLQFRNGGSAIAAALDAGGKVQDTNYKFTDAQFTNVRVTVSFNSEGGGYVTFGNVSADFDGGKDISEIAVQSSSTSDYNRPFVIDNFTMKTVDKTLLFFDVTSTGEGQSVKGAELNVDLHTYKLGEDGSFSKYFRADTAYSYTVKLPNHDQVESEFTALKADEYIDTYTFKNVDARRPMLIHAYYDEQSGALDSVTADNVPVSNNTYTVNGARRKGYTEKYFLWNSLKGIRPYSIAEIKKGVSDTIAVELKYHDTVSPQKIELTGGDDYIYIPEEGYVYTSAITAKVYDDLGFVMKNAAVEWSLPEEDAAEIGIVNGAVTIGEGYTFTEDAHVVTIRATVRGTEVYAEKELTVRKISDIDTFEVTGPIVIKNGTVAQYTPTNIKDKYGKELEGMPEFELTAVYEGGANTALTAAESNINGLTITPDINLGGVHEKKIKITVTLKSTDKKVEKTVTVYDYDFYEPGIDTASYGDPRMEKVNGKNSIVWPATKSSMRVTSIPLPKKVELTPGSCKVITFDNFATVDTVTGQERSLHFTNSDGEDIINIDFNGISEDNTHKVNVLNHWKAANQQSIGKFRLNTKASAQFTLKTDAQGVTTVVFVYDNDTEHAVEEEIGMVYDIAEIRMRGTTGAPDERLLALTNIKITDGASSGVEISGSDKISIVYGADAKKQFDVKVFSAEEGETFTWHVTDKDGNLIDGVEINNDGVLTVSDSVKSKIDASSLTVDSESTKEKIKYIRATIEYRGTKGTHAEKDIMIMDYAAVKSFTLTGPEYIEVGAQTASYSISDIIDDYGNEADMQKAYVITTGNDIAEIDMATGDVTLDPTKTGTFTVTAAVGNPDKTKTIDLTVTVAKYSETGYAYPEGVLVDVTELANYSADTRYLVTTATDDGELVSQTEQKSENGLVFVDTLCADKYEVSPIYSYTDVGNVEKGKTIPICDGTYDFIFKKANTTRADIFVNGAMVGQNVDQVSVQRTISGGSEYTARDIKVESGKAIVVMKDNTSEMDSITVKKAPSIVNRKTHVYVLGDSLASAYYGSYDSVDEDGVPLPGTGQTGWGETLQSFLAKDMLVTNLAESGSAAAALYATTFQGIIQNAEEGDYLIMECGYQDAPNSTKDMMLSAVNNIYNACKAKGVELILVTPNCAAHGTTNTSAINEETKGVRFGPDLMEFAKEKGILGVDLSGIDGIELPMLIEFGEEYWLNNFNLVRPEDKVAVDKLHSSYWGAVLHAANILTAIDEAQKDEENKALAERLAGLHLDDKAELVMNDSNGSIRKFKIGWYTDHESDIPIQEDNLQDE